MSRARLALLGLAAVVLAAAPCLGQAHEADPQAEAAFAALVDAYRRRPALTVKTTVGIELSQGGEHSDRREVTGDFIIGSGKRGVVKLRGFTCYLGGGMLSAVHESTDHSFYSTPDDGSPYYALMAEFMDIPFPHLAIAFGEDDPESLYMQFHQMAPWVVPTSAGEIERDGRTLGQIRMTSDFDDLAIVYDPESKLIDSITLRITGGAMVQPGAVLTYEHEFEYETHEDGLPDETFVLDPGPRQRVDVMPVLVARAPAPDVEGGPLPGGGGALVGQPAPPFLLATADGGAIDLQNLRGQVVVLDFWATWCGPCRIGLPRLHEVQRWADRGDLPVKVVTVNVWERGDADQRLKAATKLWREAGFTLPVAMDYTDQVAGDYRIGALPTTVIIRADGVVHSQHVGVVDVQSLEQEITGALEAVEGG